MRQYFTSCSLTVDIAVCLCRLADNVRYAVVLLTRHRCIETARQGQSPLCNTPMFAAQGPCCRYLIRQTLAVRTVPFHRLCLSASHQLAAEWLTFENRIALRLHHATSDSENLGVIETLGPPGGRRMALPCNTLPAYPAPVCRPSAGWGAVETPEVASNCSFCATGLPYPHRLGIPGWAAALASCRCFDVFTASQTCRV